MSSEPSDDQSKSDMFRRVADKLMNLADTQTSASDSEGACARSRPIDRIQCNYYFYFIFNSTSYKLTLSSQQLI